MLEITIAKKYAAAPVRAEKLSKGKIEKIEKIEISEKSEKMEKSEKVKNGKKVEKMERSEFRLLSGLASKSNTMFHNVFTMYTMFPSIGFGTNEFWVQCGKMKLQVVNVMKSFPIAIGTQILIQKSPLAFDKLRHRRYVGSVWEHETSSGKRRVVYPDSYRD